MRLHSKNLKAQTHYQTILQKEEGDSKLHQHCCGDQSFLFHCRVRSLLFHQRVQTKTPHLTRWYRCLCDHRDPSYPLCVSSYLCASPGTTYRESEANLLHPSKKLVANAYPHSHLHLGEPVSALKPHRTSFTFDAGTHKTTEIQVSLCAPDGPIVAT